MTIHESPTALKPRQIIVRFTRDTPQMPATITSVEKLAVRGVLIYGARELFRCNGMVSM